MIQSGHGCGLLTLISLGEQNQKIVSSCGCAPSRHIVEEEAARFMVAMIKRVYSNPIAGRKGITAKAGPHTARLTGHSDNTQGGWVKEDATTL
jgi:hypothetical protein